MRYEYVHSAMDFALTKEGLDIIQDLGLKVQHALDKAGNLVYVPVACGVFERTVGGQYALGCRTSHLCCGNTSITGFKAFMEQHRAASPKPDDDALVSF